VKLPCSRQFSTYQQAGIQNERRRRIDVTQERRRDAPKARSCQRDAQSQQRFIAARRQRANIKSSRLEGSLDFSDGTPSGART